MADNGQHLLIFTDGGSRGNPGAAAWGFVVQDETGATVFENAQTIGVATNNEAEYQAILASLNWLSEYSATQAVQNITWKLDSKLVVEQVSKNWKIKEPRMRVYAEEIWQKLATLGLKYSLQHIPRSLNARADELLNKALDAA